MLALGVVKLPRPLGAGDLGIFMRINADAIDFAEVLKTEGTGNHFDHDGMRTNIHGVLYPAVDQRHTRVINLGAVLSGEQHPGLAATSVSAMFAQSLHSAGEEYVPV